MASGEFTPKGHIDTLHEILEQDHSGRVSGVGGLPWFEKGIYGDQYTITTKSSVSSVNLAARDVECIKAAIREEMAHNFNTILEQMGLPTFIFHKGSCVS